MPMEPLFDMTPAGRLTCEQAQLLLAPYGKKFAAVWDDAWNEWREQPEEFRAKMDPTARSNIVQNLAKHAAKELFRDVPEVEICEKLGFFKMYVRGRGRKCKDYRAVVRLKRLGSETLLASNIETVQQQKWYDDEPLEDIRNDHTRLNVGYTLNLAQTEIRDIVVGMQLGLEKLVYWFSLRSEATGAGPTPIVPPTGPDTPDTKPTIRPKGPPPEAGI